MVGPLPLPFRSLVPLIRCLPRGRFRAAYALCRVLPPRFVTRLPRKLGGLAFVCDTADVVSRTAFAGSWEPTQTLLAKAQRCEGSFGTMKLSPIAKKLRELIGEEDSNSAKGG